MRLPASITAQPPVATEPSYLAATHIDPTGASDVKQAAAGPKPWWERMSGIMLGGAFSSVATILIAVTGAIYVGMYHAPWVKSLASHIPTVEQTDDAMGVIMATGTANAAAPASAAAPAPTEAAAPPASPDRVTAARDRMKQRVYSQVQQPRAHTVAEREAVRENEVPAPASPRRRHHSTRYVHHNAPFNTAWYEDT